jgi:hypothetical protein
MHNAAVPITRSFINDVLHASEDHFNIALTQLSAHYYRYDEHQWDADFAPITKILWTVKYIQSISHLRSAALIYALHTHCAGVAVDQGQRPHVDGVHISDLSLAMYSVNLPAFEMLLLNCNAVFGPTERPLVFATSWACDARRMSPFLQLLWEQRKRFSGLPAALDPSAVLHGQNALQSAVSARCVTNPAPDIVRQLVERFGADPRQTANIGQPPLDRLLYFSGVMGRRDFETDAEHADWRARVDATAEYLRQTMDNLNRRETAVMMAHHPRLNGASKLRALHTDTLRHILTQSARPLSDADDAV